MVGTSCVTNLNTLLQKITRRTVDMFLQCFTRTVREPHPPLDKVQQSLEDISLSFPHKL